MFNQSVTADRKKRGAISKIYKTIGFSCCSLVYYHPIISWLINTSVAFSWTNTKKRAQLMCFCVVQKKKKRDTQSCWAAHSNYSTINPISIKDRAKFPFFFLFRLGLFLFLFSFGVPASFHQNKNCSKKKIYSVVPSAWPSSTPPPPTISARSVPGDIAVTWLNEARSGRSSIVS